MESVEFDKIPLLSDDSSSEDMVVYRRTKSRDSEYLYHQVDAEESEVEIKCNHGEKGSKIAIPRHLGLAGCIWYIVGQVIGTGVFIAPSGILRGTNGSVGWALVLWVLCGLIQFCGALIYAEIALIMPKSGGDFTFLLQAWGPMVSFCRLWSTSLIAPISLVIQTLTISKYLLTPFFQCIEAPTLAVQLFSACVILFLVFVNCVSIRLSTRLTTFLTVTKVVGLIIIIVSGIHYLTQGHTKYLEAPFSSVSVDVKLLPIGFYSGLFAFSGWEIITSVTEEVEKPNRNIPLSLFISMTGIVAIYVMSNIAYFTLLSPDQLLASEAVAADYSVQALHQWSWTIWIFVAMSAMGSANASIFARSRCQFAAAREGYFPEIFAMINLKHQTPLPSIAFLLVSLVFLVEDDVIVLIEYSQMVDISFILLTCSILPYYRWKYPNIERPFKAPLICFFIYAIAMLFLLIVSVYEDPVKKGLCFFIVLSGLPIYFAFFHKKYKLNCTSAFSARITRFLQRVLYCIHQEKASA